MDYSLYSRASTVIHAVQGASLFLWGAAVVYGLFKPQSRVPAAGASFMLAAGAAGLYMILEYLGGGSPDRMFSALQDRGSFYLLVGQSLLFCTAGFVAVMGLISSGMKKFWRIFFVIIVLGIAAVYFMYPYGLVDTARRQAAEWHNIIGALTAAAAAAELAGVFLHGKAARAVLAVLLFLCSALLLQYRESDTAYFRQGAVTVKSFVGADEPAPF